jgi:hypothetical protein
MDSLSDFYTKTAIWNAPKNTGRVPDIAEGLGNETVYNAYRVSGDNVRKFDLPANRLSEVMMYRQTGSALSAPFFSTENINRVQNMIQQEVIAKSGGKYRIDRQSDDELFLIMRSYYLQYARNDPDHVQEELDSLNLRVIAYASDRIMVEIGAFKQYRADQENFPAPISNPANANIYGTRTGELKSFF